MKYVNTKYQLHAPPLFSQKKKKRKLQVKRGHYWIVLCKVDKVLQRNITTTPA